MEFTYTNFAIDGVFTLCQPIFRTIFIFSIIFLAIVIAGQLLWFSGVIIDELALSNKYRIYICLDDKENKKGPLSNVGVTLERTRE